MQRYLPVVISICLLIAVAILRNRSRTLAALLVTMPINLPLGFWIISTVDGVDQASMDTFVRSTLLGLVVTFVWLLAVWALLRAGYGVWPAMLGGYAVWAVIVGVMFAVGWLRL